MTSKKPSLKRTLSKTKSKNREIDWNTLMLALTLATLIFVGGIILGNMIVSKKYVYLTDSVSEMQTQTQSMELQYNSATEDPCTLLNVSFMVEELNEVGSRLTYMEQIYGKSAPEILELKTKYSQLQIRHWILQKKSQEKCDTGVDLILFFYSNERCEPCERQGEILSALKSEYPQEVLIYSHDIVLTDTASATLRDMYEINSTPTVVYNDRVYREKLSLSELRKIIDDENAVGDESIQSLQLEDSKSNQTKEIE